MINYNFAGFDRAMSHLKSGQIKRATDELKTELNKFFNDSACTQVIYTKNTDKLFFGMTTFCILTNDKVDEIVTGEKPVRIDRYYIEIDSKLLEIGLTSRELTAVLLHEVGHVVNDSTPVEEVRAAMDKYMAQFSTNLDLKKTRSIISLFKFAVADTVRKSGSIFTSRDPEILADEFVFRCGYGDELQKAFKKIVSSSKYVNNDVNDKFITLQWTLRVYRDIKYNRLMAIKVLNKIAQLSGSEAEKQEVKGVIKDLQVANMNEINEVAIDILEESDRSRAGLVSRIRRSGLKGIEEDLYEYQMRIRNVDNEDDAIVLMRQINTRMSVLDDYICYADCNESDRKRWEKVYEKYDILRDELARKSIYNRKSYGLWLDYNYANAMGYPAGDGAYSR